MEGRGRTGERKIKMSVGANHLSSEREAFSRGILSLGFFSPKWRSLGSWLDYTFRVLDNRESKASFGAAKLEGGNVRAQTRRRKEGKKKK